MTKPIFYEGQQVGCLMLGEGIVTKVTETHVYTGEGCYFENGAFWSLARPTLYPIEQYREIIKNLPAPEPEKWQPKPGEWCWFWNNHNRNAAVIAKFVQILNKKYMAEISSESIDYLNCAPFIGELPEHLKEVKE